MEGALQTSELVLNSLCNKIKNEQNTIKNNSSLLKKVDRLQMGGKSSSKKKGKKDKKKSKKIGKYTMKQVEKHNKKSDAWLVISKKVYNVTKWIDKHPGGMIIMKGVGKDATKLFNNVGHSSNARKILKGFQIGILI